MIHTASAPVVDPEFIDRLVRFGGNKLLSSVIDIFLEEAPGRIDMARTGAQAGDAAAVRRALHSLKSSAAQLGATALSVYCAEGELLALHGTSPPLLVVIENAERAYAAVRDELVVIRKAN